MQFIDPTHQRQIGVADRSGLVAHRAETDVQQRRLSLHRESVGPVDHHFALSNPALVSALSKKSFSTASCPILACSGLKRSKMIRNPPLDFLKT